MRHTATRLVPCAINKVVHVNNVHDPALKRLVKDRRLQPLIRRALKDLDQHYELLIPYAVDNEELQLKRYIQMKLGVTVNLSVLRKDYRNYYLKVSNYGPPSKVLKGWGLGVTYDSTVTEEELAEIVADEAKEGVINSLGRNSKLYRALAYHAEMRGETVGGYLKNLGYFYKGGKANARSKEGDI